MISNGIVIARDGKCNVFPRVHQYAKESTNSVNLKKIFSKDDFKISAPVGTEQVDIRIIEKVTQLVTKEKIRSMTVVDGQIQGILEKT